MTTKQQAMGWIAFFLVFFAFVYLLRDIMLPFVIGMAVAYFLDPVADMLERWGLSRAVAVTLITLVFFLLSLFAVLALIPLLVDQVIQFAEQIPALIGVLQGKFALLIERLREVLPLKAGMEPGGFFETAGQNLLSFGGRFIRQVLVQGAAFFNLLSLLIIAPVVSFYLLLDWDRMVARVDGWLPRRQAETIRRLAKEIDRTLASFVRGQTLVCLALGGFYGIALALAGLDFGLLIGVISGALSFIPFVGAIFGGVLSIGLALFQFWPDWPHVAIIAAIFVIGQMLEGNVLTPRLVGKSIGLHPVWVIFGLMAGGSLFGFVGMLIAVPSAAAIGVVFRYLLEQYLQSRMYANQPPGHDGGGEGG